MKSTIKRKYQFEQKSLEEKLGIKGKIIIAEAEWSPSLGWPTTKYLQIETEEEVKE